MRIQKCWFCGGPVYPGHGIEYVRNDSKRFRFCRSKCHKNFKMKRNPRKTRWTKAFRRMSGREMTVDSTLEFEKRRNRPIKYDRDLMQRTVIAMKRVQEIRAKREKTFYKLRMKDSREKDLMMKLRDLEKDRSLIAAPDHPLKNPDKIRKLATEVVKPAVKTIVPRKSTSVSMDVN